VIPFVSDWLHRSLDGGDSAHLAPFPTAEPDRRDPDLEEEMDAVRRLVSLGRSAREEVKIRVRQPLRTVFAVLPGSRRPREELLDLLRDELNVKEVRFLDSAEDLIRLVARPNFRALGPRFQKGSEAAAAALRALGPSELRALRDGESTSIELDGETVPVEPDWLEIVEEAAGDLIVKSEERFTAALDPALDDELRAEGMARELVNRIQRLRKDSGLEITDRIRVGVEGPPEVREAVRSFQDFIARETLAVEVNGGAGEGADGYDTVRDDEIDGASVRLALSRAG
jgi:isoleucyl-tRNA synthetase